MTDVLFPNQPFDIRPSDYSLTNADWFFSPSQFTPASTLPQRRQSADLVLAQGFQHSPAITNSPPSRCASHNSGTPFYSDAFRGIKGPMSHNKPFEDPASNPVAQTILYSNARPQNSHPSTPESGSRPFAAIAPDPVGLQRMQAIKQSHEFEEANEQRNKKRRLTSSSMDAPPPPPLRDEDKLLLQLKDDQSLPWKDIAACFQTETGKVHMIPALQMRYKRLKERLQVWTDTDVDALKQAHEYWESKKFEIISSKMLEYGASEKFSARACQKKWLDLHPTVDYMQPLHLVHSAGSVPSSVYGSNPASPAGRAPMPQFNLHGPFGGSHPQALYAQAPTSVPTQYSASSSNSSLPGQQGCQSYSSTPVSAMNSPFPQQQQTMQQPQGPSTPIPNLQSPFLQQPQPLQPTSFPDSLATPTMQQGGFLSQPGQQHMQLQPGSERKFVPSPQHSATFPPVTGARAGFWH